MSLSKYLFGWRKSSLETYAIAYKKYGGSVNLHPDIIAFLMRRKKTTIDFWHYEAEGDVVAAYFKVNKKDIGCNLWREYPLSYDEVKIPIKECMKVWLPERCNRLSPYNANNIINTLNQYSEKRRICYAKDSFSNKTKKKRLGEKKRFIDNGGEIYELNNLSNNELAEIYVRLFKMRFGDKVQCYNKNKIADMASELNHLIYGTVLFFNREPCAIDLVWRAESDKTIYFDVPNGGVNPKYLDYSPGSIVMWENINNAKTECIIKSKEMCFSIGLYENNWDYKLRWAEPKSLGKVLFI
ncbi:TPA: Mig-14 family protein [Klebsiella pneumoniae]|nr:Mig-14 family protein [Klebsiella pneumoniae]